MEKNTWNIKCLVDDSFVPLAQRTSVLYCKLTDFYCPTLYTVSYIEKGTKWRRSMARNDEKLLIKRHLIWSFLQGLICLFVKYLLHVTAR